MRHEIRRLATLLWILIVAGIPTRPVCALASDTPPASRPAAAQRDRQYREDLEAFREHTYRMGDKPSEAAALRMIARAKGNPNDAEALFWAGRSEDPKLYPKGRIDRLNCYRRAAQMGCPTAMAAWGLELCLGTDVPRDLDAGLKLLREAAADRDLAALWLLGSLYALGAPGLPKDFEKGEQYLKQSLHMGCLGAVRNLAASSDMREDTVAMERYLDLGVQSGDVNLMNSGLQYWGYQTNPPRDSAKARQCVTRGALWGDPLLMRELANAGGNELFDIKLNRLLILRLLMRAARAGDQGAEASLAGLRVAIGTPLTVQQGHRTLERLLRTAEGEPRAHAAFILGTFLFDGRKVPQDRSRGLALIERAAREKSSAAQIWLKQHENRVPEKDNIPPNAAPASRPAQDEQALEDAYEMHEWFSWAVDPPTPAAVQRIVARARGQAADASSMCWAAIAVSEGWTEGVPPKEAIGWLSRAAEQQDLVAMALFGSYLVHGLGSLPVSAPDARRGMHLMRLAAARRDPDAVYLLARSLTIGTPDVPKDLDLAAELLNLADKYHVLRARWRLAVLYRDRGDSAKADEYCLKAVEACDPLALSFVAQKLFADRRPAVKPDGSFDTQLLCGALVGHPDMTAAMGLCLVGDPHLARLMLRRAAAQGSIEAQAALAAAHITGEYQVEQDVDRGQADLEMLAARHPENPECLWQLGRILCEANNIPRDMRRGRSLIEKAAQKNYKVARAWLAKEQSK